MSAIGKNNNEKKKRIIEINKIILDAIKYQKMKKQKAKERNDKTEDE